MREPKNLETVEELEEFLRTTTRENVRGRLLARGEARAVMRDDGQLPADAPPFAATIDTDLADYGFSVLRAALALREAVGSTALARTGFEKAANAFEALVRNGPVDAPERGFYRVVSGAAYHLAGYSAIAYALFNHRSPNENYAIGERALVLLILRDLDGLNRYIRAWLLNPAHTDARLSELLTAGTLDADEAIGIILNTTICRALAHFDFALATGEASLVGDATNMLASGLRMAADTGAVSLWWIIRLCLNLLDDLWGQSLHLRTPNTSPPGGEGQYSELRSLFLGALYARRVAEVELWPSQVEAARRSSDLTDDLVVALPTSAGKTRIAELAALMTLATNRRVLIVTPLRALSAQTERSFRRTFAPLGFSISSLYGASGMAAGDEDALRTRHIVIATPEKLDFALRTDATLIDDVGLIVLDEGHLIGLGEREIRYEILVHRLLRRPDAENRRIVCLSAILPEGQELDDLTGWIRDDAEGEPVLSRWRPTRQRYGLLRWRSTGGFLSLSLESDGPFISRFIQPVAPKKGTGKAFPKNNRELTLAAAWKFASDQKRTLIYCTQRNHVEGYAKAIIDLAKKGFLGSFLDESTSILRAVEIGREWLGEDHPAVQCLMLGVAIHHARLPNAFLRELERLLNEGILKVIVASPTLAQGLNLNAAVLLVPNIYRAGAPLKAEEFANVAGRAGRAFVDVEGLVVHVMYESEQWRMLAWNQLVNSAYARTLESGLIQLVAEVLARLSRTGVLRRADAIEYLANSREAWEVPDREGEESLTSLLELLDTAVLGLVEALDSDAAELPRLLDEALRGSLWARQLARRSEQDRNNYPIILKSRGRLIWTNTTGVQRRGLYAMGVGLDAGLALEGIAESLGAWLDAGDQEAISGNADELILALTELGRQLFQIRPFVPDNLPENWEELLRAWVSGVDVDQIGAENMKVIEDAFTYQLVWGLEALRARRAALGWVSEIPGGGASAVLETGVPRLMMVMLIRSGLPSRRAAIEAIRQTQPSFVDGPGMQQWLEGNQIAALTDTGEWPTAATASIWRDFREQALSSSIQQWNLQAWHREIEPETSDGDLVKGGPYRVEIDGVHGDVWVCTPAYQRLCRLRMQVSDPKPSLYAAWYDSEIGQMEVRRMGRLRAVWRPQE